PGHLHRRARGGRILRPRGEGEGQRQVARAPVHDRGLEEKARGAEEIGGVVVPGGSDVPGGLHSITGRGKWAGGQPVKLRPELMPPALDEEKVQRLARLAAHIDGAAPGLWEDELAEFNREAGTALEFLDFQGVSGGQDHDAWVRNVLAEPHAK